MTRAFSSTCHFKSSLCFTTSGVMISFKNLMDSLVCEKCFRLKLRQKPFGNLYLDKPWEVLPLYISCIGRKSPCNKEIANVPVIERLSELPSMMTEVSPLGSRVLLPTRTYFNGVWSMFKMSSGRMLCFSTLVTISCKNENSISLQALYGMSTFEGVFLLFTKFILASKLLAQREEFTSISPADCRNSIMCWLFSIRFLLFFWKTTLWKYSPVRYCIV